MKPTIRKELLAGGDGTIKMVAEAMENYDVIIGILPAGSANGLAVEKFTNYNRKFRNRFHNDYMEIDMIAINGKKAFI
jgi:diacylglycerol kinase family enzyme